MKFSKKEKKKKKIDKLGTSHRLKLSKKKKKKKERKRKKIDKLGTILNLTITLNIRLIQEALFGISNFYYKYSLKIQTT